MTLGRRSNSGYLMGDASDLIDVDSNAVIGKQGVHTMNDVRVYEKRSVWSLPSGLNPRFHTTGTASGVAMTKDMQSSSASHNFLYHASSTGNKTGIFFTDLGTDIFDSWGYFGLSYTSQVNASSVDHEYIQFGSAMNQADGVINENTWTASDGTSWTVKHGHPVANMWMAQIIANTAGTQFQVSMGGNMGSDGNTYTRDSYRDLTLNTGQSMRIHFRENSDSSAYNSNEQIRWYYFPTGDGTNQYGTGTSTNIWHNAYVSGDNHYHYSNLNTQGSFTIYMAKGSSESSTSAWVADDLTLV